jgi:hypothetical protein
MKARKLIATVVTAVKERLLPLGLVALVAIVSALALSATVASDGAAAVNAQGSPIGPGPRPGPGPVG